MERLVYLSGDFCIFILAEFESYFEHVTKLDSNDTPNYSLLREMFVSRYVKCGFPCNTSGEPIVEFDWGKNIVRVESVDVVVPVEINQSTEKVPETQNVVPVPTYVALYYRNIFVVKNRMNVVFLCSALLV